MRVLKHKTYMSSMLEGNPEILDVDFYFDDGKWYKVRLRTVPGSFEALKPEYMVTYLLNEDTPKSVIPAIEKYLRFKRNEMTFFWLRAAAGVIGLGIILGLFLIL